MSLHHFTCLYWTHTLYYNGPKRDTLDHRGSIYECNDRAIQSESHYYLRASSPSEVPLRFYVFCLALRRPSWGGELNATRFPREHILATVTRTLCFCSFIASLTPTRWGRVFTYLSLPSRLPSLIALTGPVSSLFLRVVKAWGLITTL